VACEYSENSGFGAGRDAPRRLEEIG
jgi:hypothetical protein